MTEHVEHPLLPEAALLLVANRFKLLADPTRLRLINLLQRGEMNVTELVAKTQVGQANVSKHLSLLADASIVSRRREGAFIYYFISDPIITDLCRLMCSRLQAEFSQKSDQFRAVSPPKTSGE